MTNTTNTELLKPCPFCGQPGFLSKAGSPEWFSAGCSGLFGCPAYLRAQVHRTEAEATAAWNRRAALAEAEAEGQAEQHPCDVPGRCAEMDRKCDRCSPIEVEGQAGPQGWHAGWLVSNSEGDEEFINNRNALEGRHYRGGAPLVLSASFECLAAAPDVSVFPEQKPLDADIAQIVSENLWSLYQRSESAPEAPPAPAVSYVELTDAECDEFRRHQGDFNSMLRATHRAGYSRGVVSPPAPREPLTVDEATKNKYGEWTHTTKGQPVADNVPMRHECDGGSDYCTHCGIDMCGSMGSSPCDGLEQARRRQIKPETVTAFGCDDEARGLKVCKQWCQGLQCPYTRSSISGDENAHGIGTDREGG